jgi:hypothetical protein
MKPTFATLNALANACSVDSFLITPRVETNPGLGLVNAFGVQAYCAFTQSFDPATLTATSVIKMCTVFPSAVPLWSVEISNGPAFL